MKKEIAILMAAGKGERMQPITFKTPKPLVKVHGVPMIETVIQGLERRNVEKIYVVVGHLKEQFDYLPKKYPHLTLVENTEYMYKNNISSIYAVKDVMGTENVFLCEADLVVSDPSIFDAEFENSCYYGKMVEGHSDDWVFDLDKNGRVTRIGKYGDDAYNMCGISYFKKEDAKTIIEGIEEAYKEDGHENLFWDEICNRELSKMDLRVHPVKTEQIVEIDSVKELQAIDESYKNI